MMGVPGVYLPSLFGSKNDADAVIEKGETLYTCQDVCGQKRAYPGHYQHCRQDSRT